MKRIYIKIDGIHCVNCENTIKYALLSDKKIKRVSFDGFIAIVTCENNTKENDLIKVINDLGYYTNKDNISDDINDLKNNIKLKEFVIILVSIIFICFLLYKVFGYNIFNMIPTIDSNVTYGMLFITGLLTSIHCISMCGSINLVATVNNDNKRSIKRPLLYNIGRIISYTIIGGLVGLVGKIISFNNIVNGIIIILASIVMLLMSLTMLNVIKVRFKFIKYKVSNRNPFIIGLLNGLMPCGPLQAMQIYALSTGSVLKGALSMLLFGLGTVPLMLITGVIFSSMKGKTKILINKIASVLILLLSIVMFNRGLLSLDIDILKNNNYGDYVKTTIKGDYQEIDFDLEYDNYKDIIVQKDIPVKIIINASNDKLTGCNNEIIINEYGIKKKLEVGENIIEFTPKDTKTISYTCWMNMIKNNIKVIDDIDYFEGDKNE